MIYFEIKTFFPLVQRASNNRDSPFDQVHPNFCLCATVFLKHFSIARSRHVTRCAVTAGVYHLLYLPRFASALMIFAHSTFRLNFWRNFWVTTIDGKTKQAVNRPFNYSTERPTTRLHRAIENFNKRHAYCIDSAK